MKLVSVFEKYKDYDKKVILLAIKTMTGQQKMVLKKGYGSDYNGEGFLYSSEMNAFEMADRALGRRIKEVDDLNKQGKTEKEILNYYMKNNTNSILSMYTTGVTSKPKATVVAKPIV